MSSSGFVNNKGADKPARPCSLFCAFVVHLLESIMIKLAITGIFHFLASLCS